MSGTSSENREERVRKCIAALVKDPQIWDRVWAEWFDLSRQGRVRQTKGIPLLVVECFTQTVGGTTSPGCRQWPAYWKVRKNSKYILCNQTDKTVRMNFKTEQANGRRVMTAVFEGWAAGEWLEVMPKSPEIVTVIGRGRARKVWPHFEWRDGRRWKECGGSGNGAKMEIVDP